MDEATNVSDLATLLWAVARFTHKEHSCFLKAKLGSSFLVLHSHVIVPMEHIGGIDVIITEDINKYLRHVKEKS